MKLLNFIFVILKYSVIKLLKVFFISKKSVINSRKGWFYNGRLKYNARVFLCD